MEEPAAGGVRNEEGGAQPPRLAMRERASRAAHHRRRRDEHQRMWLHRRRARRGMGPMMMRGLDPMMMMVMRDEDPRHNGHQVREVANQGHNGDEVLAPLPFYREVFLLQCAIFLMKNTEIPSDDRCNVWVGLQLAQGRRRAESEANNRITRRGESSLRQEEHTFGRLADFKVLPEPNVVEQVTTAPDFDPTQLFIKKCTACVGWAVHGLVFELVNGQRMGVVLGVRLHTEYMNVDDKAIESRGGVGWTDIDYGDYIVAIHGNRLSRPFAWLCHSVVLQFHSGKVIRYESEHEPWRGAGFSYSIPQPSLVYRISFGHGQSRDARGLLTAVHVGISPSNMQYLPPHYKQAVQDTFDVLQKIDTTLYSSGAMSLGDDLWRHVMSFIAPWQLHAPPFPVRNISADAQETFQVLEQHGWERAMVHERLVHHGWNSAAVQDALVELTDMEQRLDAMQAHRAVARGPLP